MATRRNLCPNPKAKNNVTGWGGGSVPVQATGLSGFPTGVTTGARYTAGTFMQTPTGAASPGVTYTGSMYIREGGPAGGTGLGVAASTLYLAFTRSSGGDDQTHTVAIGPYATNTPTRVSFTFTAPALTTGVYLLWDSNNFAVRPCDVTAVLLEASGTADTYFDGDTVNAVWDGANGNSTSTLTVGGLITGNLGQPFETDTPFSIGRAKLRTFSSITSETDTGQSTTRRKLRTLGLVSETDTGLGTWGRRKLGQLGLPSTFNSALGLVLPNAIPIIPDLVIRTALSTTTVTTAVETLTVRTGDV